MRPVADHDGAAAPAPAPRSAPVGGPGRGAAHTLLEGWPRPDRDAPRDYVGHRAERMLVALLDREHIGAALATAHDDHVRKVDVWAWSDPDAPIGIQLTVATRREVLDRKTEQLARLDVPLVQVGVFDLERGLAARPCVARLASTLEVLRRTTLAVDGRPAPAGRLDPSQLRRLSHRQRSLLLYVARADLRRALTRDPAGLPAARHALAATMLAGVEAGVSYALLAAAAGRPRTSVRQTIRHARQRRDQQAVAASALPAEPQPAWDGASHADVSPATMEQAHGRAG